MPEWTKNIKFMSKVEWITWKEKIKEASQTLNKNEKYPDQGDKVNLKRGTLLKIQGLKNIEGLSNHDVRILVLSFCEPVYVDYKMGSDFSVVRFYSKNQRNEFFKEAQNRNIMIKGRRVELKMIEDTQVEDMYFEKIEIQRNRILRKLEKKKSRQIERRKKFEEEEQMETEKKTKNDEVKTS